MVQLNLENYKMVMELLSGSPFEIIQTHTHSKYTNDFFDVIIKNNSSIIVVDKREKKGKQTFYRDLKLAYHNVFT